MKEKALLYGKMACDTMMAKFNAEDLPPKGGFHYHAGVFLSGMMNIYSICKDEKYFDYMKAWVDSIVKAPGIIQRYKKGNLDDYMAAILFFPLIERTNDAKYTESLKMQMANIRNWVRSRYNGYYHMEFMNEQMWLDGLYMAGPLQALYTKYCGDEYFLNATIEQAYIMYDNMQDKETKLMYHAWDGCYTEEWKAPWSSKETGLSEEFWGRAMGWYVVAIADILETMDKDHPEYAKLCAIENEIVDAIFNYQDKDNGMWYQVVDKGDKEGNWVETSCSCLFTYAAAKSMRLGIIENGKYSDAIAKAFDGIMSKSVTINDNKIEIGGVCIGTGVCDYQGYIDRPTSINDLHGMGAFLLMCAELAR